MTIYPDTDVVISSLLSKTGGAHLILFGLDLSVAISPETRNEIEEVISELNINIDIWKKATKYLKTLSTKANTEPYSKYVLDPDDVHSVAGAHKLKANFLLTYNLTHYKIDKIQEDLGISVLSPGQFLQYLRSRSPKT